MKKIYSLLITSFIVATACAQDGYHIKGSIKGIKPAAFTLVHYFGANQYITKDTAVADANGTFVFSGNKSLPQGLYILLQPNKQRLADFVIGPEQHFTFNTDTTHLVKNMHIEGSPDSELFYKYQQGVATFTDEIELLQIQQRFGKNLISQTKMNGLRRQIMDYFQQFIKENGNTLTGKIMAASGEIQLPPPPKRPDGRPDSAWLFRYYKAHFWDNYDFSDDRLVRTPMLQRKLDRFMQELTFQSPDSLIQSADFVIDKAIKGGNKEVQSYCIWYLTNQAESPSVMGTEAVFVHLAEKYYIGGIMPTTDSSTVQNIRTKVNIVKPLLVGKTMPTLSLSDTLGTIRTLTDVKAKYTIVFFYDPDCSHCRKSTPILKAFYDKSKSTLDLKVYAVSITRSPEQWKKFIHDFGVQEWLHGYDYSFRIDFRKDFDVVNAPMMYVLDENKKIITRRLPAEELEGFIDFYEKRLAYEKGLK